MHSISKNFKNIRKEKGWTQQQMADHLFVTRQTVSNWENGRALPDLETIEQISEKLDIDSEYLLYGKLKEEKYRKLNSLSLTLAMTALLVVLLVFEKVSYIILRRISEYAGYPILESGVGYGEWIVGIMLSFFLVLWMIVLLFNWVVADNNSLFSKFVKFSTNLFLIILLIYSTYSMVTNCIYTYNRYKNIVITAHERFEIEDNLSYLTTYMYYDFGWQGNDINQLAYIDNDDAETDEFMERLIASQALKVYRVEAESKTAQHLMWKHGIENVPAIIIVTNGNAEVLEGYDKISTRLESKIHNYKMHNIFFY